MSEELKKLAKEYDDAPDDAEWELPHPIFRMALENYIFKAQNVKLQSQNTQLVEKAKAVIARWDSPKWKDEPHTAVFINQLREAVADIEKGNAAQNGIVRHT